MYIKFDQPQTGTGGKRRKNSQLRGKIHSNTQAQLKIFA